MKTQNNLSPYACSPEGPSLQSLGAVCWAGAERRPLHHAQVEEDGVEVDGEEGVGGVHGPVHLLDHQVDGAELKQPLVLPDFGELLQNDAGLLHQ